MMPMPISASSNFGSFNISLYFLASSLSLLLLLREFFEPSLLPGLLQNTLLTIHQPGCHPDVHTQNALHLQEELLVFGGDHERTLLVHLPLRVRL